MQTYEDKIKEFAQPLSNNSNKILVDTIDKIIQSIIVTVKQNFVLQ